MTSEVYNCCSSLMIYSYFLRERCKRKPSVIDLSCENVSRPSDAGWKLLREVSNYVICLASEANQRHQLFVACSAFVPYSKSNFVLLSQTLSKNTRSVQLNKRSLGLQVPNIRGIPVTLLNILMLNLYITQDLNLIFFGRF